MELTVIDYERTFNRHICLNSDGDKIRVDLMVGGDFHMFTKHMKKEQYHYFCLLMVGRTFEVETLHPHEYIGLGVREIKKEGS